MSILIVEHQAELAVEMEQTLRAGGYDKVYSAESAEQVFELLGLEGEQPTTRVDLILLDMAMPGMVPGFELSARIKAKNHLVDIPIIAIIGEVSQEELRLAYGAGIIDYIRRPLLQVELLTKVNALLRIKHELDRRRAREQELLEEKRQLQRANEILRLYSVVDGLTGAVNSRHFEELYNLETRRARRSGAPIALIQVDIDYLRLYNETYGHHQGDACLRRVAEALQGTVQRAGDIVARTGGEEFTVLLPGTDRRGAKHLAEQMRQAVLALQIPHKSSPICPYVTVSLGVAAVAPGQTGVDDNLQRVSGVMVQRAKTEGRNRVCDAEEGCQGDGA